MELSWAYRYGYHVMLFSFLDTHPNANLPRPIDDRIADNSFLKLDRLIGHDDEPIGVNMHVYMSGPHSSKWSRWLLFATTLRACTSAPTSQQCYTRVQIFDSRRTLFAADMLTLLH